MPRIRTIKPAFWKDQKISKFKRDVRLMFIGLWNLADDEGVVHGDAALIKSEIFPFDEDLRVTTVNEWIDQLIKARLILPFVFNDESYYLIRTFKTHQTINRPQDSKIPVDIIQNVFTEQSVNETGTFTAGKEGKGRERKGKGRERKEEGAGEEKILVDEPEESFTNPFSEHFQDTWAAWKRYKRDQFGFTYKSPITEQAAMNDLVKISKGDEVAAGQIVMQSISKGWKGFFEIKKELNGSVHNGRSISEDVLKDKLAQRIRERG